MSKRFSGWIFISMIICLALSGCSAPVNASDLSGAVPTQVKPLFSESATAPANPVPESSTAKLASPPGSEQDDQGITVGFTEEGYPFRGDPKALVTLIEYSDFLCPFCGRHFSETYPSLTDSYLRTGKVKYIFRDYPIASLHPTAHYGHQAALCAAKQGAKLFWEMHDKLFENQSQWRDLPDPTEYLKELATNLGVDMTAYQACMSSGETKARVDQGISDAEALGFNGTPSFQFVSASSKEPYPLIGAYPFDTFAQWLDALLAGKAPPQEEQATKQEQPELPYWANTEGLAPDPSRPGYTMAGDPFRGDPKAKLVVVEFSDFQCPACQKHHLEIQPAIDSAFVDSGQVMWVFKNFLLKAHPQAPAAGAAAECAGDQGKFWEMHDLLYKTIDQWAVDQPDTALIDLSGQLNLDQAAFTACLGSRTAMERVLGDLFDAQGLTSESPTFVVIYGGAGRVLRGSLPADQFTSALSKMLAEASGGEG